MENKKRKKHWYLGFLGLIGVYEFPHVLDYFNGAASAWALLGLLWFLWFDYFIPKAPKVSSLRDLEINKVRVRCVGYIFPRP